MTPGWGCSSLVEHWTSIYKALGLMPSTIRQNNKVQTVMYEWCSLVSRERCSLCALGRNSSSWGERLCTLLANTAVIFLENNRIDISLTYFKGNHFPAWLCFDECLHSRSCCESDAEEYLCRTQDSSSNPLINSRSHAPVPGSHCWFILNLFWNFL